MRPSVTGSKNRQSYSVAVKQIFEHVRDGRAAAMRPVDVVVIDTVRRETGSKGRAVTGRRGRAEARNQRGKVGWRYAAFLSSLRLIRHSAICTAFNAAPLRKLSATIQSERPYSTVGSLRMRDT